MPCRFEAHGSVQEVIEQALTEYSTTLEARVKELEKRLGPIDPGGGDKIDELESAIGFLRDRAEKSEAACAI